MSAAEIIRETQAAGVRLSIDGAKLTYTAPAGAMTDTLRAQLRQHRDEIVATIIADRYGVTLGDLKAAAGGDWDEIEHNPEAVEALALMLRDQRLRERGEAPPGWTNTADCAHCGPVWLWAGAPAKVLGCPWCFNRAAAKPIPRPRDVWEAG